MASDPPPLEPTAPRPPRVVWATGLSARLLLLTCLFVVIGGLFVLPPSLAAFEEQWLLDRVRAAELASLATDAAPDRKVTRQLSQELLEGAGVVSVAMQTDGMRRLVLEAPTAMPTPYLVDLRSQNPSSWLSAPFATLMGGKDRLVRVIAEPRFRPGEFVEIVTPDAPLRVLLWGYLVRLAGVTAFVAGIAGLLVYASLNLFLVAPMQRITRAMERFRVDPSDPAARVKLSGRLDEVGRAEAELDRMQSDLLAALASRARLAALGQAVAKINHDLRNMLTSAQLASDRLAALGDPKVAQAMPRLERALDRAITLASEVMAYGKAQEPTPEPKPLPLKAALEDAAEDAGLSLTGVRLITYLDGREQVSADPDQLYRILVNLLRNAREAIEALATRGGMGVISITLVVEGEVSVVSIADDGPGIPDRALSHLFQPFAGSARRGGTGLGLAIARELAQGHGGDLTLVRTGSEGSVFELRLPGAPEPLAAAPKRRRMRGARVRG